MKSAPYIATELLEIVIDELGAEAETLPSSSAAFQALLSLSLTGPRARPRCELYLFSTLTFDNTEHKERPNANPAWIHLQATLELFKAKPHLASYVRHLKISFYSAFPSHRTVGTLSSESNRLESAQEYAETMLPQALSQLSDVISFSFDAHGYTLDAIHDWFNLPPRIRTSIVAFLARSIEEGNLLQELCLSSFKRIPADIFRSLPRSLTTFRLGQGAFDSHGIGWFFPEQWTFVPTELECEGHYAFLQTLLQYESGKHLSNMQKLSCSIRGTLETIALGWMISACCSSLRSLDISVYGEDEGVLRNIRGKVQLPHLRSLSLTADVEGYSKTIPRLVKNLASRAPNLQSVAIHAVWSVDRGVDTSGPSLFIPPRCGWEALDETLSLLASLQTLRLRVTPHATCAPSTLDQGRFGDRASLSEDVLDRAKLEMLSVFKRTKERASVEMLNLV